MSPTRQVFRYALGTAIATGLGAIPFAFIKKVDKKVMGRANAIAAGLMLGATYGLLDTGFKENRVQAMWGVVIGALFILFTKYLLDHIKTKTGHKTDDATHDVFFRMGGRGVSHALLILIVMTVHSAAEGIGVGTSFGGNMAFGITIAIAIAIHNVPEGLAISAALVGKGKKRWEAGLWSIFTSLPQPLFAVPAYIFILQFQPYVPLGLGFSGGAMLRLSFADIIPEAQENLPKDLSASIITFTLIAMMTFQFLLAS